MCVVDLESRHLSSQQAASRAAAFKVSGPAAHKIDSTLRGNWARELVARGQLEASNELADELGL